MGDASRDRLSDRGSIPLRSTKSRNGVSCSCFFDPTSQQSYKFFYLHLIHLLHQRQTEQKMRLTGFTAGAAFFILKNLNDRRQSVLVLPHEASVFLSCIFPLHARSGWQKDSPALD